MGFGFAKSFIIFLILAVGLAYWSKNILAGVILIGLYAAFKIIWKILTK